MSAFDLVIHGGEVFDGRGNPPKIADVAIKDGVIAAISELPLPASAAGRRVDARGAWVTPGFIDFHTHYDVEVEVAPALSESLRHGVTTVTLGSCSIGATLGTPEEIADIFCRVEAIPRPQTLEILRARKTWSTLPAYLDHLETLALGPNITAFVGHSNLRIATMGFRRAVDRRARPAADEVRAMERLLEEGLDAGYLGLSIQTLPWDKLDGDVQPGTPLPSYYARWSEIRRLTRILRRRDRVFQGVPNVTTKVNVLLFLAESVGLWRPPLRTTVISLMDLRCDRTIHRIIPLFTRLCNRLLGGDFRLQALPEVFDLWADGLDLVVFEEFASGTAALSRRDPAARAALLRDPAYRRRFRREWRSILAPKVFHRDLKATEILACPDASRVGRSFAEIAAADGRDPVDVFLDLVAEHGAALRWYTVMANDRRGPLERIVAHPDVLIGFSDAGAHLRQMSHYNFPLRLLRLVRDAERDGRRCMSVARAVHRLTGEIAEWFGIDAGVLEEGRRADVVVVDPAGLDDRLEAATLAPMPGFGDLERLVRRNPAAIRAVAVGGSIAALHGELTAEVGHRRLGQVLRSARERPPGR